MKNRLNRCALAVAIAATSGGAMAEEPLMLEEVIVTAQLRAENL